MPEIEAAQQAVQQAAKEVAEQAAEQAAKEAEQAAEQAAEQVAEQAAEQAAKEAIQQLFQRMGIQQVICVDDTYFNQDRIELVLGLCVKVDENKACEILGMDSIDFDDDDDIWKLKIRKRWNELSDTEKESTFNQLSKEAKEENVNDARNAELLGGLLEGHEYKTLSFHEWQSEKSQLLELVQNQKVLVLFDQDFSGEGQSTTAGIGLILDVLSYSSSSQIICGLLSGMYSPEGEHDAWEEITREHKIPQDKFVLLSKKRLSSDPIGFARMVKLTVLNPNCKLLTERVSEIVDAAHQAAKSKIEQLNIYNYEQIVFQSSLEEGTWEPDTLFRLFRLFHKKEARGNARNSMDVRELADKIREVCRVKTGLSQELIDASWQIQRLEFYDTAEDINPYHLPLEAGDIFQKTEGGAKYILLAQPCDLVVRQDGKRNQNINEVVLSKIVAPSNSDNKRYQTGDGKYYELRYFNQDTGASHYVDFRDSCAVKLSVLDLCVFQKDGSAKFEDNSFCPATVIPTWSKYYIKLAEGFRKEINNYCAIAEQIKEEHSDETKKILRNVLKLVTPRSSNENLFKAKIIPQKKTTDFGFKRVERLCQPYAGAMLTKFAQYSARAAFEHDFGKIR